MIHPSIHGLWIAAAFGKKKLQMPAWPWQAPHPNPNPTQTHAAPGSALAHWHIGSGITAVHGSQDERSPPFQSLYCCQLLLIRHQVDATTRLTRNPPVRPCPNRRWPNAAPACLALFLYAHSLQIVVFLYFFSAQDVGAKSRSSTTQQHTTTR
ncbi:hypothetical protein CCHR01_06709 [Colletotrichum chrysophilum]|uniref:Uncharacterized protein n=1 Tax=Colletotrichum chrysophilum TaxID=1836956 RepID=A0AAD9EKD3_9PEZI|nr:hypothetical protein CCHR01_06709 [Colletotrichum chrysophilum]